MERRAAELRAGDGRTLSGLAVPYAVETKFAGRRERFEAGAAVSTGEAVLNLHHRIDRPLAREPGTLRFESRADGLHMTADLPETAEANDALALVRAGVLRGLSVEFRADVERMAGGVRVIEKAMIGGAALVARAAYPTTRVEARGAELSAAVGTLLQGPELVRAADAAGISEAQLRRALQAFAAVIPEPGPARRGLPTVWL